MSNSDMDILAIRDYLPHRYPFLMVDFVRNVQLGESAVGIKNVSVNEPFFPGHFPDRPIFPGVLIVEALAQTAAVLVGVSLGISGEDIEIYFMSIEKARFRKPVVPGDVLELHVRKLKARERIWRFEGKAKVGDTLVADCEFAAMFAVNEMASEE